MSEHPPLLIVWHSQTGACRQAAEAVAQGYRQHTGMAVELLHADDAAARHLLCCRVVVFVAAENLAALSGRIKDFFDRTYYSLLERVNGKPFASVICAGSDGSNAQRQLERIATGLRLRRVAEPLLIITHAQSPQAILAPKQLSSDDLRRCQELGQLLAVALELGLY